MIKMNSTRTLVGLLVLLICPLSVFAQTATTNRNVILRRDPSTASVALAHLSQGARLTLVDDSPTSGFYHVRTEDDQVGWAWSKYVTVSGPSTPPPTLLPTAPPAPQQPATQCDSSL